jgi:hypothetical protein
VRNPNKEFLLPLIFYGDRTGTDALQRHGIELFMLSTSIITLAQRQFVRAWRVLVYLADLKAKASAKSQTDKLGKPQRDYHKCLELALQSLIMAQNNVIMVHLRLGDQVKLVRLHIPVAMLINDGKSADVICNRYQSYQKCGRISRACDAPSANCSSDYFKCNYLKQQEMDLLQSMALGASFRQLERAPTPQERQIQQNAQTRLAQMSTHAVRNAFSNICFGGDPRGIYGATPTDLMHAFNEGLLKYCMKVIFDRIPPSKKAKLDDLVDKVFAKQCSSVKDLLPRTNFVNGFTNLTLITASEWIGVCFTTFVVSMLEQGQQILLPLLTSIGEEYDDIYVESDEDKENHDVCNPDQDNTSCSSVDTENDTATHSKRKKRKKIPCSLLQLQQILQALVCFYAWTKSPSFDCSNAGIDRMRHSITVMLDQIKLYLPRDSGMGWDLQKFHDIANTRC